MPGALRVAFASCQRWEHGHYAAWRHLAADQPDLVLFLSDYIYEYASGPSAVRPTHTTGKVRTLADYRNRYALHKSDPHLQAAHAAAPWLVVWDDHEVDNDYADVQGQDLQPNFAEQRVAAYRAYWEHLPLPKAARPVDGRMRIYGALDWGRLARILLLDEPFGALDAKVRKELRRWLRRLHDELHITSIFVTHDQEEALEVADRVVLMNQGQIEQVGTPQEVWDHPAMEKIHIPEKAVDEGDVNLFHGRVEQGEVVIGAGSQGLRLDAPEHRDATTMARLELIPEDDNPSTQHAVIEAQLPASQYRELGLTEGELLVLTPRKARVFMEGKPDLAQAT
eukprot:gene18545-26198_t